MKPDCWTVHQSPCGTRVLYCTPINLWNLIALLFTKELIALLYTNPLMKSDCFTVHKSSHEMWLLYCKPIPLWNLIALLYTNPLMKPIALLYTNPLVKPDCFIVHQSPYETWLLYYTPNPLWPLIALLDTNPGLLNKEGICSLWEEILPLNRRPLFRREQKQVWQCCLPWKYVISPYCERY